ncbi:MAG: alpha/beta hydrolase [Lysobacter sp.]|nr:alpha/beta hydrolase [Lysobacter sp.]
MPATTARNSTNVRSCIRLATLRLVFRLGAVLQPGATVRRAGALFCTPLPSTRQRARATTTGDARIGEIRHDGERLRTYAWGDPASEPYVLFAHGWSSHGTRFLQWVAPLRAAGFAVVAFDQPAHGHSSGRRATLPRFTGALRAVGDHFGPAAAVVGHSLGGAATAAALAGGMAAARAVLLAPAADPVDASLRFARYVRLPERLCRRMIAGFESRLGVAFDAFQAHRMAPRIGCPALVVHDLQDTEVPWAEGERYARHWPQSRLLSTRGLGHNRLVDDSRVIDAVLCFLRGGCVGERVVSSPNLPFGVC